MALATGMAACGTDWVLVSYARQHFPGTGPGLLTGYPLTLGACCALTAAATALAVIRKSPLAMILAVTVPAIPWAQAMSIAAGALPGP